MDRKDDHIRVCLEEHVDNLGIPSGFEAYRFDHDALPEIDKSEIRTEVSFLGKTLRAPLLIGAMTGGTARAGQVNRILAEAAHKTGVGFALGSQRPMVEDPSRAPSYAIRDIAPSIFVTGNIGAVQLNYGVTAQDLIRLVETSGVDALTFHLNPLQEAIQPGGDTNFKGLMSKLAAVIPQIPVPVIVKEVGSGISETTAEKLAKLPISAVETAGVGGTSWAKVESFRAESAVQQGAGQELATWGVPTAESILACKKMLPDIPIIASGGVRSGVDIAKSIALGAHLGALAKPFLHAAQNGTDAVVERIEQIIEEIRTVCFVTGCETPGELQSKAVLRHIRSGERI